MASRSSTPVSYRLDPRLKARLSARARQESITETALVERLLDEGLKAIAHPGIIYRDGPSGRRAVVAGGPDVWEIISGLRHTGLRGEEAIQETAEQIGIPERLVSIAVAYAAAFPTEIDDRIARNDAAARELERVAAEQKRFLDALS